MELLGIIGTIASVIGGFATWYWGTKKKRLIKAIDEQQKKIRTVEEYTTGTGYKLILRDCFHSFAYAFSIIFISLGLSVFIYTLFPNPHLKLFLLQITSAIFVGSGLVIFDLFMVLSKTFKAKEHIDVMSKKLVQLKSEHENS